MSLRWWVWRLASQQPTIARSLNATSGPTPSRHACPLVPLHSSLWTGKSSMRSRRCLTIVKSEGKDSTSFNGRAPPNPHGSGRSTSTDVWTSSRSTLAGLASKDAFSRLSSPVQCRRALREEEEPLLQELPRCLLPLRGQPGLEDPLPDL